MLLLLRAVDSVPNTLTMRSTTKGAKAEPILAHKEDIPIAMFLTTVGTSSAEYMYATPKAAELKNLPNVVSVTLSQTMSLGEEMGQRSNRGLGVRINA